MAKIKLGQINFINCLPVNLPLAKIAGHGYEIIEGAPAKLNSLLSSGKLDLAPISSFEYLKNKDQYHKLDGISISSKVNADSVLFFADDSNLKNYEKFYITNKSASSINLLRIILKIKYGIDKPYFEIFTEAHEKLPNKLLIGDEALYANQNNQALFDLGEEWFHLTSLPMVFGLWTINKNSPIIAQHQEISEFFCGLRDQGLDEMFPDLIIEAYKKTGLSKNTLHNYFKNLDYNFECRHGRSLELYHNYLRELDIL